MDCSHQAPLSMEFSRQEWWSGSSFPSAGDLPDSGIEPRSPALHADSLLCEPPGKLHWNQEGQNHHSILHLVGASSEVAQSCPTLFDPMDCSLPGSSVHGIFQALVLEWIAISFSRGSSWPRHQTQLSRIVDRRFTAWATRKVHQGPSSSISYLRDSSSPFIKWEEWIWYTSQGYCEDSMRWLHMPTNIY